MIYRIRRTKRDETKPTCRRCRDSRIKCDGYARATSKNAIPDTYKCLSAYTKVARAASATVECHIDQSQLGNSFPANRLDFQLDGSESDRLFFHHFRAITIVDFVRLAAPNDFWFRRVLPMCHKEPAVQHTVVALGAAHYFYLQKLPNAGPSGTSEAMSNLECVATHQYNKAIFELVKLDDMATPTPWDVQLTTLTCCVLFVCLENILGRFEEAARHMQAGARFFESWNISATPHHSRLLMQEIATLLLRFGVDASIFAGDYVIPNMTPYAMPLMEIDDRPRPFATFTEARDAIWDLDVRAPYVDCLLADRHKPANDIPSRHDKLRKFAAPFSRWKIKFNLLLSKFLAEPQEPPISIQREVLVLNLRRCMWDILLFPEHQNRNLQLSYLCHELIDTATRLYSIEASWLGRPMFTLDSDSIPALFFVAMSCENQALVKQIIALLRDSGRREGSWDSQKAAERLDLKLRGNEV